jgi:CRP-like cAMP-binding protein
MYDIFRKYIDGYISTPINDDEFELVQKAFLPKKLRKKQYLVQEGDVCKYMAFICKGAMRFYSVDDKGIEHIIRFGIENWWITDRESFLSKEPSVYNVDAVEDCELLVVTKQDLDELNRQSSSFAELSKILEQRTFVAAQKRIHAAISRSAEERYNELQKINPSFIQRFPQNMIASYLGVSPETLSRIRKQALSK